MRLTQLYVPLLIARGRLHLLHELKQRALSFTAEVLDRSVFLRAEVRVRVHGHGLAEHVRESGAHVRRSLLVNLSTEPS